MLPSFSRRSLMFSRGFNRFPTASAIEGVKSKADSPLKADIKEHVKGKNPDNKPMAIVNQIDKACGAAFSKFKENPAMQERQPSRKLSTRREGLCPKPRFSEDELAMVEKALGYRFKRQALVGKALTHPSYYSPCNLKRSEHFSFLRSLGQATLNGLVGYGLWGLHPYVKAEDVDTRKLGSLAVRHKLHHCFRHKEPLLERKIQRFAKFTPEHLDNSTEHCPPEVMSQIVISLLGAVYQDSGNSLHTLVQVLRNFSNTGA